MTNNRTRGTATVAPIIAPRAVLPEALPITAPIAPPAAVPTTAPFWVLFHDAQPDKIRTELTIMIKLILNFLITMYLIVLSYYVVITFDIFTKGRALPDGKCYTTL
jgi:hypothetical protein